MNITRAVIYSNTPIVQRVPEIFGLKSDNSAGTAISIPISDCEALKPRIHCVRPALPVKANPTVW